MEREKLKTALLVLLVFSSLLLTLAIWNYQPDFEMTGDEENLVDPQIESGQRLTRSDVLKPIYAILHDENAEQPSGLMEKVREQDLFRVVREYSLYNFSSFNLNEDWWEDHNNRLEIVFATELPATAIYDMFALDQEVSIPTGEFDRIEIIFEHESYQLIFRNEEETRVIGASLQNYNDEINRLARFFASEDLVSYEVYQSSRGTNIYLPNQFDSNILLFSYQDLPIDPFRNFLFPTPSVVRSSRTSSGNTVFIDGTRELIVESNQTLFTNQTNVDKNSEKDLSPYELFDQVQNFINTHNGFTIEQPFSYFLSHLEITPQTNRVEYTLAFNGVPIYADSQISNIHVAWHNQEVYQYRHPLITLVEQRGVNSGATKLIDANSVIEILNGEGYSRSAVYDVMIGYRVREQIGGQGQVYELIPTWYVKGINGWNPLIIPSDFRGGE